MDVVVEMLVAPVSSASQKSQDGRPTNHPGLETSQPLSLISAGTTSLHTVWQTARAIARMSNHISMRVVCLCSCSGNRSPPHWPGPLRLSWPLCASSPYEAIDAQIAVSNWALTTKAMAPVHETEVGLSLALTLTHSICL